MCVLSYQEEVVLHGPEFGSAVTVARHKLATALSDVKCIHGIVVIVVVTGFISDLIIISDI